MISFSLKGRRPRISIVFVNDDDEDDDPFGDAVFAQRIRLNEEETDHLFDSLPSHEDCVEVPFVTRMTRTNLVGHVMKLPKKVALSSGIAADEAGFVGVHLRARGVVTTCAYKADTDGRIILGAEGWKDFLVGKNLQVGQAVLVTIRNTARPNLRMMMVIDII